MRICVWVVILLVAAPVLLALAQSVPSAAIEGAVLDAVTGKPVSGVLVTRRLPGDRPKTVSTASGSRLMNSQVSVPAGLEIQTQTGPDGRFSIEGLDSGRIDIAFGKNGYIVRTLEYTLNPNERSGGSVIRLTPYGVISGHVSDAFGRPMVLARIQPMQYRDRNGSRQLAYQSSGTTNDQGDFRLVGLPPGEYLLRVSPEMNPSLPGTGFGAQPSLTMPSGTVGYMVYPGVTTLDAAEWVEVKAGEETRLRPVILDRAMLGRIRVHLVNPEDNTKTVAFTFINSTQTIYSPGLDGDEGDYYSALRSISSTNATVVLGPGVSVVREHFAASPGPYWSTASWKNSDGTESYASGSVNFTGEDTDLYLVTASPTSNLTCRAFLEGPAGELQPLERVQVALRTETGLQHGCMTGPDPTRSSRAVHSGVYDVDHVIDLPKDTYVSSIRQGQRNVLSDGVVIVENDRAVLDVFVRSAGASVIGRVMDPEGHFIHDASVQLMPEPNESSLAILRKSGRTDQRGLFEIHNLAPGTYRIYALREANTSSQVDGNAPERRGQSVQIGRSGHVEVNLQVIQ